MFSLSKRILEFDPDVVERRSGVARPATVTPAGIQLTVVFLSMANGSVARNRTMNRRMWMA